MGFGSYRSALGISMTIATLAAVAVASCSMAVTKAGAADDEIIRTIGVETDCFPIGAALCMADTARISGHGEIPDQRLTRWLVFAASGDSLQAFMAPSARSYLSMSPASAAGYLGEHSANEASFLRARFARTGTYVFTASLRADSVGPYDLRVLPVVSRAATRPNGGVATVVIDGDSTHRYAIVPRSVATMTRVLADSGGTHAAVRAGTYRVLLVRDSLYLACRVPCGTPVTFALRPGGTTTIAPR